MCSCFFRSFIKFLLLFRRHCVAALFKPSSCSCQDHGLFVLSILPECRALFSSSIILSSFTSLLNRSAVRDLSYPLPHSFNSFEGSVLWFHQVSSHLIKFLFNPPSFHSECCLNLFFLVTLPYRSVFNFVLLCCILSLNLFNFSRFIGFTRLSKKQLSFTSSLSLLFSLWCHSRSRDEILS